MHSEGHVEEYRGTGCTLVRALFSREEAAELTGHYTRLREAGSYAGDFDGVDLTSEDPLKRYPRMIHMHRWDETSLRWLLDPRLNAWMTALLGAEPYAVQTMVYFKPPGARGQALHQDQFYLCARPGNCLAAWLALDAADEENGCLQVVPASHDLPVLCTEKADTSVSFTDVTVPVPAGTETRSISMEPGDVLFFNGSLIHGSGPNTSRDRFRRALIGHYIEGTAREVAQFYHPVLRMDGTVADLAFGHRGDRCGVWVEREGRHEVELAP
jgi:phytanoyl-CoA hydroxylase